MVNNPQYTLDTQPNPSTTHPTDDGETVGKVNSIISPIKNPLLEQYPFVAHVLDYVGQEDYKDILTEFLGEEGYDSLEELGKEVGARCPEIRNTNWPHRINFARLAYISDSMNDIDTLKECIRKIIDKENCINNKATDNINTNIFTGSLDKKTNIIQAEYSFNPTHKNLETLGNHFGIIPLIFIHNLIYDSGMIEKDEYLKKTKANKMITVGRNITITKQRNEITIGDTEKVITYMTITVAKKGSLKEPSECNSGFVLRQRSTPNKLPHRKEWIKIFSRARVPKTVFGMSIDPKAAIIEVIGIQFANALLREGNTPKWTNMIPTLNNEKINNLKGIFAKVHTTYIHSEFEQIIRNANLKICITHGKILKNMLIVDLTLKVGNKILGTFNFQIA